MRDKIIELIENDTSLKEISENLGVNYNTVRQISVSNKLVKKFSEYLTDEQIEKIKGLGNNIRALSSIKDDKESIITLVEHIYEGITRKELEDIVLNIDEVKKMKSTLTENINIEMTILNENINNLNKSIKEITKDETIKVLEDKFKFIRDIKDKEIRKGYLNLIAIKIEYNRPFYSLGRRVNLSLWNKLRRSKAIIPGKNEIIDMEKFIEMTINTIKRNNYYKEFQKENKIIEIKHFTIKNQLKPLIEDKKLKIVELKNKVEELKDSIGKAGKNALNDYFLDRELRNEYVTKNDSITHPKIQQGAAKWLYNNGYISTIELSKDKYKFDVIGYDDQEIIIIEAKASLADIRSDKKLMDYTNYCDKLYVASNDIYVCMEAEKFDNRIGVIKLNDSFKFQKIIREAINLKNGDKNLIKDINKKNSRKFIFGY